MSESILHAHRNGTYPPISDYALIGDTRTAALVARDGSIDWYCWPEFASPATFCRLLDARRGGYFQICPTSDFQATRTYVGATNVLATTFKTSTGTVRLRDLMLVPTERDHWATTTPTLVRIVEGVAGEVDLQIVFRPTLDYAGTETKIALTDEGAVARGNQLAVQLSSPARLALAPDGATRGSTHVTAGQKLVFLLECTTDDKPRTKRDDLDGAIAATSRFWEDWAATCQYQGPYRDTVVRSALVLKMLTFEPSGALVAAPTTSLPEVLGGVRNWDYRYTWLRDSALILEALELAGYGQEAGRFFAWLRRVWMNNHHDLQIMYATGGGPVPPERDLDQLSGYADSRPVRVGNAAARQTQLDVFGEVLEAAHYAFSRHHPPEAPVWQVLRSLADEAARRWNEVDRGIWEVRGDPHPFLYSRVLCWAALQRAIDLAHQYQLPADLRHWAEVRDAIKQDVLERGFNRKLNAFTQYLGGDHLDASALVIPMVGFLAPTDPRVLSTIKAIEERLTWNGLLLRYVDADGLPPGEAAFAMCSFWLVDDLAMAGQIDRAKAVYERLLSYTNDVGLLSEEIDPIHHRLLGNFPQGFSHLGIIRSAYYLARAEKCGADQQPTNRAERTPQAAQAAGSGASKPKRGD